MKNRSIDTGRSLPLYVVGIVVVFAISTGSHAEHRDVMPMGARVTDLFVDRAGPSAALNQLAVLQRHLQEIDEIVANYEQARAIGNAGRIDPLLRSKRQELMQLQRDFSRDDGDVEGASADVANGRKTVAGSAPEGIPERLAALDAALSRLQTAQSEAEQGNALNTVRKLVQDYRLRAPEPDFTISGGPGLVQRDAVLPKEQPTARKPAYMRSDIGTGFDRP